MKILKNKLVIFLFLLFIILVLSKWLTNSFFPTPNDNNLWFYSGLLMVLISSFFIEEYYTSPRNIIANILPLIVIFIAVKNIFINNNHEWLWWVGFIYILFILLISFISIVLSDEEKSPEHIKNIIAEHSKNIATTLGKGKVVYSAMFLYFIITSYAINDYKVLSIMFFWWLIIAIEPQKLINKINQKKKYDANAVGRIISVQSKKIFLVKLFENSHHTKVYDIVSFKYSVQDSKSSICNGFVLETFLLNDQKWVKIILINENTEEPTNGLYESNIVYKKKENVAIKEIISRFVGIVVEGSEIGKIYFECYNSTEIQEGFLLEVKIGDKTIYYQLVQGVTQEEIVEKKNETGFIKGEAVQLGMWNNENYSFEKYGWVPEVNTVVLLADTSHYKQNKIKYPEFILGSIPNTKLPAVINLHDTTSHHLALLGITGSGKSFITQEIIKELLTDTIVICVDFTGEWEKTLQKKTNIIKLNTSNINDFLTNSNQHIGIVELPSLSNTIKVIESTEKFLSVVFDYAKKQYDIDNPIRICLILEEAHTIIPESTFLGVNDWDSKAVVNKMGQIALQGRKYGVGLIVIAQRTANVSKTVLTQCNTIVCFQAFDETSFIFLNNFLGKNLVNALPNLKKYHSIVTGKGVKSNIPMIVDLTRKT
jgi:hypothetical protein